MKFVYAIEWIRPGEVSGVDITSRVLNIGEITRGISDAGDLFAVIAGDVDVILDDQDDFFTDELNPSGSNLRVDDFEMDIIRDGIRWMKGFLHPEANKTDRRDRTITVTILGFARLLSETSASKLERVFPDPLTLTVAADPAVSRFRVSASIPLEPEDIITFGDSTTEFTVRAYTDSPFPEFETIESLGTDDDAGLPAGTRVNVLTRFPRNKSIKQIAEAAFNLSGINVTDVEVAGGFGTRPFTAAFNSSGLDGFGEFRGFSHVFPDEMRAVMSEEGSESPIRSATDIFSGFVEGTPFTPPLIAGSSQHGNYFDERDQGETAPVAGDQVIGLMDYFRITPKAPATQFTVRQSRFTGFPFGAAGTGVAFELRAEQIVDARAPAGGVVSGIPDYREGGRQWSVGIVKLITVDGGVTWLEDGSFQGGAGFFVIASAGIPPTGQRALIFLPGESESPRGRIDPEQDWSISSNRELGAAGGNLYVTVQEAVIGLPRMRRLELDATRDNIVGSTILRVNVGSCKAMRLENLNTDLVHIFYRDNVSKKLILGRDRFSFGVFLFGAVSSISLTGTGLSFRNLKWNTVNGLGSRVATTFRSTNQGPGIGWFSFAIFRNNASTVVSLEVDASARLAGGSSEESLRLLPQNSAASDDFRPADLDRLAVWIPQPANVAFWVGKIAGRYAIISSEVTGFVKYFDFEKLSMAEAMNEMTFVTNAQWRVEIQSNGQPKGLFKPRETIPTQTKIITDFDLEPPPGGRRILIDAEDRDSWEHSYNFVRITDGIDPAEGGIERTAGNPDFEQDGLEITLRLLEQNGELAQIIADKLLEYYGGIVPVPVRAGFNLELGFEGVGGGPFVVWQLLALDIDGRPVARSLTVSDTEFAAPNEIRWDREAFPGLAVTCEIYRVSSQPPGNLPGLAGSVPFFDGLFTDNGTNAIIPDVIPPETFQFRSRKSIEVVVADDGFAYSEGDEMIVSDRHNTPGVEDPSLPLKWLIQQVKLSGADDLIQLSGIQKNLIAQ